MAFDYIYIINDYRLKINVNFQFSLKLHKCVPYHK
nr:MAG TPA: hypothetical protein [Caudoviricetes sp.]